MVVTNVSVAASGSSDDYSNNNYSGSVTSLSFGKKKLKIVKRVSKQYKVWQIKDG